jgi:hypothetical protein
MIKECEVDEGYTVIKKRMKAWDFYRLPEFTGF